MESAVSPNDIRQRIASLADQYRLVAIYAFGSRAGEIASRVSGFVVAATSGSSSDVDIGVLPERDTPLTARDRVRIAQALEDLFGCDRVDLVVLPEARAFLARDVVTGELLHSRDADAEAEYQLYVLRRADDLAPFERARLQLFMKEEVRSA